MRGAPQASLGHAALVGRREKLVCQGSLASRACLAGMALLEHEERRGTWGRWACVAPRVNGA